MFNVLKQFINFDEYLHFLKHLKEINIKQRWLIFCSGLFPLKTRRCGAEELENRKTVAAQPTFQFV